MDCVGVKKSESNKELVEGKSLLPAGSTVSSIFFLILTTRELASITILW